MPLLSDPAIDARTQRAVESLLENESLTADLMDAEAKRLIEWGTAQAGRLAQEPAALEDRLIALRKLMRGINKLAAERRPVDDERLRKRLKRLFRPAAALGFSRPDLKAVEAFVVERRGLSVGEKQERLLALLRERGE